MQITQDRLFSFLNSLLPHSDLILEMDCFHGTAYLRGKTKRGTLKIDLSNGSMIGSETGRLSCKTSSIHELDRDKLEFKFWEGYIGIENHRGEKLTEEQLRKWVADPNRMLECVFCRIVGPPSFFEITHVNGLDHKHARLVTSIRACPRCREYKGIQPHIPDWSDFE